MGREMSLIETHSSDILVLCKELKQTIIDGIREDFKEINHDMNDNYEKSMIIREHLNKKDAYIKRIDDLIKLLQAFYESVMSSSYLSEGELRNRLSTWNEEYHNFQVTYKDVRREYDSIYGGKIEYISISN